MKFEMTLDMYNGEQEAVWLQDYLQGHQPEDLEIAVKESEEQEGTLSGGILLPALVGVISGIAGKRIEWLLDRVWEHFSGKKGNINFNATCPDNGQNFSMSFSLGSEKERDEAQAEFKRRFESFCNPS